MAVVRSFNPLKQKPYLSLNDTLTSGITKEDASQPISEIADAASSGAIHAVQITVNNLVKNIASDAALAFGEHIASFPSGIGLVLPLAASVSLTGSAPTGLSATAGEVGLGTVIGSGANATLGAVGATCENIMEGQTIANHVAATPLTIEEAASPVALFDHGATAPTYVLDASASDVKIHLNVASTWDQTSAEDYTFGGSVVLWFVILGNDYGTLGA